MRGDFQDADDGTRRAGNAGAGVAVGFGKVAHGRAADEVILQVSVGDQLYRLRGHRLIVNRVGADEIFAIPGLQRRIINDGNEIGQDARVEAGCKRAVGARLGAQLGTRGGDSGGQQRMQRIGAGVGLRAVPGRDTPLRPAALCAGRRAMRSA